MANRNHVEVSKMYFDTESKQPVLVLKDDSVRVVDLVPTGNCWVEYWVTPEERAKSIAARENADREWREAAAARAAKSRREPRERKSLWPLW